jgi:hypothetical protein
VKLAHWQSRSEGWRRRSRLGEHYKQATERVVAKREERANEKAVARRAHDKEKAAARGKRKAGQQQHTKQHTKQHTNQTHAATEKLKCAPSSPLTSATTKARPTKTVPPTPPELFSDNGRPKGIFGQQEPTSFDI